MSANYPVNVTGGHEFSFWLRQEVENLVARIRSGNYTHCEHVDPDAPGIRVTALWNPSRIVCLPCAPEMNLSSREDKLCDRCGTHDGDGVHPAMVQPCRGLLVFLGLCDDCHRKEMGGGR